MSAKSVGIKELKNKLSEYLREVKSGTRIFVTERDVVIAEIRIPGDLPPLGIENPVLYDWLSTGVVRAPKRGVHATIKKSLGLPNGTAQNVIDAERGA